MTPARPQYQYEERVAATPWFAVVMRMVFLAPLAGVLAAARNPELGTGGRAVAVAGLVAASAVLLAVGQWFTALDVTVAPDALRFRFGPFGRTLEASGVREAQPAPYAALAFGGWGWRFGRQSGRTVQAFSVPFLRSGVLVTMDTGRTYYVSSRRPEALASAVGRVAGREGAA